MSKLTAKEVIEIEFGDNSDEAVFECDYCNETISSWDLGTPCHPHVGLAEGSGHGGIDGMYIYCALINPEPDEDAYCGWGGPVKEYVPLLICKLCGKSPFKEEE